MAGGEDSLEGVLNRKHERESIGKKAFNRSWDKVYTVMRAGDLAIYKVPFFFVFSYSFGSIIVDFMNRSTSLRPHLDGVVQFCFQIDIILSPLDSKGPENSADHSGHVLPRRAARQRSRRIG